MTNYTEYCDLFDTYTYSELQEAYAAIHSHELQEELYENESPLLAFLIDTDLQEQLNLYFEDLRKDDLRKDDLRKDDLRKDEAC